MLRRHPDAPAHQFSAFSLPRFARESQNHFPRAQGGLEGGISGEKTGSKSRESRKSAEKAVFIGKTFLFVNRFAPNLLHAKKTPRRTFLPIFSFLPSSVRPREPKPLSARSRRLGRRNQRGKDWVKKQRVEKERGKSSFHRKNFFVCEPICTKFATRLEEAQTHLPTNFQLSPFLGSPARAETTLPRAQAGLGAGFSGKALGKRGSTEPTVERRGKSRISWEPPNGSS